METIIANFLFPKRKTVDWRYNTYYALSTQNDKERATIYWIGIIDLVPVRKKTPKCPIQFTDSGYNLVFDQEESRDVDGYGFEKFFNVLFDITFIMDELLEARDNGENYFHLFLEETVDRYGLHKVSILYTDTGDDKVSHGIATKLPWFEEPVKKWAKFSATKIYDNIRRITIHANNEYNWHK